MNQFTDEDRKLAEDCCRSLGMNINPESGSPYVPFQTIILETIIASKNKDLVLINQVADWHLEIVLQKNKEIEELKHKINSFCYCKD